VAYSEGESPSSLTTMSKELCEASGGSIAAGFVNCGFPRRTIVSGNQDIFIYGRFAILNACARRPTALGIGTDTSSIDVEHQFSVFSDRTPPLFCQAPHIVDQRG